VHNHSPIACARIWIIWPLIHSTAADWVLQANKKQRCISRTRLKVAGLATFDDDYFQEFFIRISMANMTGTNVIGVLEGYRSGTEERVYCCGCALRSRRI
jgi:hypothetical protein